MSEKIEVKIEALPDLDDLLQCPVCYEIPSGQIFQCNEGHHVCGRCKIRLDVCPVCRSLFFGTRNYAMEELIANVRKLHAFKLGGKVTTGSVSSESSTPAKEATEEHSNDTTDNDQSDLQSNRSIIRAPQSCKGVFRCLCCKNRQWERLPAARLLNHIRYFHSSNLIEGKSENGEYIQAWQFATHLGRIATAVRISDMGIFFLVIEIDCDSLSAWLSMAASPWVAHEFCYTVTISGNDREAIFSDSVWSVRSCEGSLKKRGHCLIVNGMDAHSLTAPAMITAKLCVRRAAEDQLAAHSQPRAVLRVASRGDARDPPPALVREPTPELPSLNEFHQDVERLARAFAALRREVNSAESPEPETHTSVESTQHRQVASLADRTPVSEVVSSSPAPNTNNDVNQAVPAERTHLSRNARRRMRQRLRMALNVTPAPSERVHVSGQQNGDPNLAPLQNRPVIYTGLAVVQPPVAPPPLESGPSNGPRTNQNPSRKNKKKRRQRR